MRYLIFSQLRLIRGNYRLLLSLLVCPVYLVGVTYFADSSWLTIEQLSAFLPAVIALLSGEVLYWITIDEIHCGTFEIILLSRRTAIEIIAIKAAVPTLIGFGFSLGSVVLNNALAPALSGRMLSCSPSLALFLLFVSALSCLLELISLLLARKQNINLHFYILIAVLLSSVLVFELISAQSMFLSVAIYLCILAVATIYSTYIIHLRHKVIQKKRRWQYFPNLFPPKKIGVFGALCRKDFSSIRGIKHLIGQLLICTLLPIAVAYGLTDYGHDLNWIVGLSMAIIPSVCCISIVYPACLNDNMSNISVLLNIRRISMIQSALSKTIVAGSLASLCACVSMLPLLLFNMVDGIIELSICTFLTNYLSAAISYMCCKKTNSSKSEHITKSALSLICIVIQSVLLFALFK